MPSPATSLNTLIYKEILTLILQGFKQFSTLSSLTRHVPDTHTLHTRLLKESLKVFVPVKELESDSQVCFYKLLVSRALKN
jgi:hypothetical protein